MQSKYIYILNLNDEIIIYIQFAHKHTHPHFILVKVKPPFIVCMYILYYSYVDNIIITYIYNIFHNSLQSGLHVFLITMQLNFIIYI